MDGPGESRFDELKRYVRFTSADADLLSAFGKIAHPHFERIAREFYDRTREHEEAHAVFTGEAQIDRLHRSMVAWLGRVVGGVYDDAYYQQTLSIGRVHVKVGLPQRYMFTAMALIRNELARIADEEMGELAAPVRAALTRLLDIELAIMLESYRDHFIERFQRNDALERQALSRSLARAEHRYLNAVELARLMVVGLNRDGRVRLFNREAERVTGYARDEALDLPFVETFLPPDLFDSDGAKIRSSLQSARDGVEYMDTLLTTRTRRFRDVRWQLAFAPIADAGDDDVVLFIIGEDVTEQKTAIERAHQQEKLAAIGTLAAGLAHEIRNPLNGAQLHVSFLARELRKVEASADALDAVAVVGDEIKRLGALVTEFLDFARPKPLQLQPLTLQSAVERAVAFLNEEAAAAQVTLSIDGPSQPLRLTGDPPKLQQVLLNLLQNAIEALAPAGGGKVVVRMRRQPRHAILEVEDDGPGLPSEGAPIFDAFFSTKPDGTGLGLAIVHRIVTDHGGTIDVESRPGKTCFRITLPLSKQSDFPAEPTSSSTENLR